MANVSEDGSPIHRTPAISKHHLLVDHEMRLFVNRTLNGSQPELSEEFKLCGFNSSLFF